ncbi:MAG: hypothetical protein JXL67_07485, partial [Calditrichaeota bacterium]|nr:hypothetical protein [Calditrichota bacterium]
QRVFIGLESFDQKQLQRFRKGISVRQNLKAVITLYRLKIDVLASLILADAYTTFLDIIHQFIVLYELRRRYFNSPQCRISLNRRIEIYRGSPLYREYKQAGLLTRDHYLHGYDYRMKFLTRLRLKLFDLEAALSRLLFQPLASLRIGFRTVRWSLSHIRLNLFFTK